MDLSWMPLKFESSDIMSLVHCFNLTLYLSWMGFWIISIAHFLPQIVVCMDPYIVVPLVQGENLVLVGCRLPWHLTLSGQTQYDNLSKWSILLTVSVGVHWGHCLVLGHHPFIPGYQLFSSWSFIVIPKCFSWTSMSASSIVQPYRFPDVTSPCLLRWFESPLCYHISFGERQLGRYLAYL